jgi:hypothetical protein
MGADADREVGARPPFGPTETTRDLLVTDGTREGCRHRLLVAMTTRDRVSSRLIPVKERETMGNNGY